MTNGWQQVGIGGVTQWLSVRGANSAPVLLYLHGGPGASEFGPRRKYLRAIEEQWRIVEWEQRGAGRSFRGSETACTLTTERLVLDGLEVVEWVCHDLGVERIVLVGHSFGTVLGALIAERAPRRISAYVGAAQVVDFAVQEERGYEWALAEARRQGKAKVVALLERLGRPVNGMYATGVRGVEIQRRWLGRLGGVSGDPSFVSRWVLSILTCRDYPLAAKVRYVKALRRSMELLWPDLVLRINLVRDAAKLDVPVHLFAGRMDHITPVELIEDWHAALAAPIKRLEVVDGVGHLNLFEAPGRFIDFLEPLRAK